MLNNCMHSLHHNPHHPHHHQLLHLFTFYHPDISHSMINNITPYQHKFSCNSTPNLKFNLHISYQIDTHMCTSPANSFHTSQHKHSVHSTTHHTTKHSSNLTNIVTLPQPIQLPIILSCSTIKTFTYMHLRPPPTHSLIRNIYNK